MLNDNIRFFHTRYYMKLIKEFKCQKLKLELTVLGVSVEW